jgi:hypothetical protein
VKLEFRLSEIGLEIVRVGKRLLEITCCIGGERHKHLDSSNKRSSYLTKLHWAAVLAYLGAGDCGAFIEQLLSI